MVLRFWGVVVIWQCSGLGSANPRRSPGFGSGEVTFALGIRLGIRIHAIS